MTSAHKGKPILAGFFDGSETEAPSQRKLFLDPAERATGMHVIGSPGSGKSKFLEWLIRQDIDAGHGVGLIDPHGSLYRDVLAYCALRRPRRPVYCLNLSAPDLVFGFNPFRRQPHAPVSTQARRNLTAALKAWKLEEKQDIVVQLNRWATNVFTILIEKGLSVPEIELLIEDDQGDRRAFLTSASSVQKDWDKRARELKDQRGRSQDDPLSSTHNRLSALYRDVGIRRFMGITDPLLNLDLEKLMDEGGIVLVNLQPSDYLAEMSGRMFGTMLMTEFFAAARRRNAGPDGNPRPFYLYADEAQEYLTSDIARIFAQGRKMGLSLILAHQYLDQVAEEDVRILSALHNACKTKAVFGIGGDADAKALVHELWPGQIDLDEVKRIDYSVKFWPVYDRDQVHTKGRTSGWGQGTNDGTVENSGNSSGMQWLDGEAGAAFVGASFGTANIHGDQASFMESESGSVADVPIYRPVPFLEERVTPWSLEEQRQRLADALRGQYQRHCFFRGPDMQCRPLLVPKVESVPLSNRRIDEYVQEIADKIGAIRSDVLDLQIEERHRAIEVQATKFAELEGGSVDSIDHEPPANRRSKQRTRGSEIALKPQTSRKKPASGPDV